MWAGWPLLRPLSLACGQLSSPCVNICVLISSSSKDTSRGMKVLSNDLIYLNHLFKGPVQSQSEVLGLALPVFVFAFGLQ